MRTTTKHALSLIVMLGIVLPLSAQNFNYGAKLGTNFTVQSEAGDLYSNNEIKIGWQAGIFGSLEIAKNFSLQTEINYEQKGNETEKVKNSYEYITIPLTAKWSLGKSLRTPLRFNIYAGPYLGFLINAENEIKDNEIKRSFDVKANSENTEFGLLGGFGIIYPLSNNNIFLDFRFGMGLNQFDKSDTMLRNKCFGINIGFEF